MRRHDDTTAPDQRAYTARDVANLCGISVSRVHQLVRDLGIGQKIGRDWLFSAADIDAVRNRNTRPGRPPRRTANITDCPDGDR